MIFIFIFMDPMFCVPRISNTCNFSICDANIIILVLNKKQCFAIIKKKHSTWQHIIKKNQQTNKSVLMQFPSNKENNIKLLLIHSWWDKYLSPFSHLTRVQAGLKPESDTLNWCVFLFLPPKMHKTYIFTSCHLVVTPVRLLNSKVREKTR